MILFPVDLLGGMLLVLSLILLVIALITYRRYHLRAAMISSVVFLLFFVKALIYEANIYFQWSLELMGIFFLLDVIILAALYFSIALRG